MGALVAPGGDFEPRRQGHGAGLLDAFGAVVRRPAAAQDDVAIRVAVGGGDGRKAVLGDRQEVMWLGRGADRVDGDLNIAVGAVLEADRAG